jgi:hypothetical protein
MRPEIDIDAALQHTTPHRKPWGDNMVWIQGARFAWAPIGTIPRKHPRIGSQ